MSYCVPSLLGFLLLSQRWIVVTCSTHWYHYRPQLYPKKKHAIYQDQVMLPLWVNMSAHPFGQFFHAHWPWRVFKFINIYMVNIISLLPLVWTHLFACFFQPYVVCYPFCLILDSIPYIHQHKKAPSSVLCLCCLLYRTHEPFQSTFDHYNHL